jgi:sRNA-binding regulator protein Hfq
VGGFQLSRLEKKQNRTLRFVNKSLKMHLKNGIKLNGTSF